MILRALALYGVLEQDDWSARLEHGLLEPAQVTQIRLRAYEKLLWLAEDVLTRKEDPATGAKLADPAAARRALAYVKKAEALPPSTRALCWIRSRCWRELGDAKAAKADVQRAKEAPILMAVDHYLPGKVAALNRNKAEAVKEFEAALRVDPSHYWSLMWLGWCLSDLGQGHEPAEAVRVYTGCLLLRPRHAEAHFLRGRAYYRLHNHEEALADHTEAIKLRPDCAVIWYDRGLSYGQLRQHDKALDDYSEAIKLKPDFAEAWYNRGCAYYELRQYDKARDDYSEIIKLNRDFVWAWYSRGLTYRQLRQYDKARDDCSEAIKLKPEYAEAWYERGNCYTSLRQYDKARDDYSEAIKLKPDYADAWCNRGNVYLKLRQYDNALADHSEANKLKPDWALGHSNLAGALRFQGRFAEALAAVRRADELGKKQPDWPYRSATWVRDGELLVQLDKRLPAVVRGEDKVAGAGEWLILAQLCYFKQLYGLAARFTEEAFAMQPALASDRRTPASYNAACYAALAGCGQGKDDPPLDVATRARWRAKARDRLAADLAFWIKVVEMGKPEARPAVERTLEQWLWDPDLAGLRDAAAIAKLPEEEREAWRSLWVDVRALLKQASEKSRPGS